MDNHNVIEHHLASTMATSIPYILCSKVDLFLSVSTIIGSDNFRGHPRLRIYAVPDDVYVWNSPTTSHPHVDVAAIPSGGEPAGCRNVSINVNFNTKKVLMYKFSSTFMFEVSEVQFFNCSCKLLSNIHPVRNELAITMHTAAPTTTVSIMTTDTTSLSKYQVIFYDYDG